MKKVIVIIMLVAGMLPAMAQESKSAKVLNEIMLGMSYGDANSILGFPEKTKGLGNGKMLYVYKFYTDETLTATADYYAIYEHNSVVEIGMIDLKTMERTMLPFGVATSEFDSINNICRVRVSSALPIRDKIFICNRSPYPILRVVVVDGDDYQRYIAGCNLLRPNECREVDDAACEISTLSGRKIGVKAKGVKNSQSLMSIGMEVSADEVTYNFTVTVGEENHDLYIYINGGIGGSSNLLDF